MTMQYTHNGSATRSLLYSACFCVALAYGLFFLLPLYVQVLGGDERVVGKILVASALGTLSSVTFTGRLLTVFRPGPLAALGAGLYAAGGLLFAIVDGISPLHYFAGILLGAGWGLTYTVGPLLLSDMVDDACRTFFFSVLSAFNMLGLGVAPVVARWFLTDGLVSYHQVFLAAALLASTGSALFLLIGWHGRAAAAPAAMGMGEWRALRIILGSEARYPLLMVLLGACVFSSMMNFQTTFAAAEGLDFSYFYIAYTAAVIGTRFLISGWVGRRNPQIAATTLLCLMCASIALFGGVGGTPWVYAVAAALLGVSYGLVYPLIQAMAINLSEPAVRSRVMVYFCLSYFIGVYVFPYFGAHVIIWYGYPGLLIVLFLLAFLEFAVALWRMAVHLMASRRVVQLERV